GNGAGIDELDPLAYAEAMDAADSLSDAMLPDADEEADGDDTALRLRLDTAEAALDRIRASHVRHRSGHCVLCWEADDPLPKATPAAMPCAALRSIAGADVSAG